MIQLRAWRAVACYPAQGNDGSGAGYANSSARISEIEDVRAVDSPVPGQYRSYSFNYNTDATPHLTAITPHIGNGEGFSFGYLSNQSLSSPFSPPVSYGSTTYLGSVTGLNLTHTFEYAYGAGELTRVILPLGGAIRWNHRTFTYTNGKSVREVWERYLTKQSGAAETRYWFWRDDATDANRDFHYYTALFDPSGPTREWYFGGNTGDWWAGLITALVERPGSWLPSPRRQDFTWAQNPALNPYIATSDQTLDQGQTFEVKSRTQQTLDAYGNVTETKLFDYGSLATPARTYSYSYLDNSNYTPRYIRNRLISASVSTGGAPTTLVSNSYDGASPNNVTGLREHDTANYGTSFLYRGNPTQTISAGKTLNRVYDITGNVVSSGDGLGHSIQVTAASNSNNAVPGLVRLNGNTSSDQTMQYNGWLGLTGVTAPNGATASFSYYGIARPATTTSPHGAQTTYAYTTNTTTATTNGHWVKTTYDGFGRTIKVETGDGASTKSVVDTEYDSCACSPTGKVKRVSQPYAPGAETLYWTTYNYAGFGNPRATNVPLASPNRGRSPSPSVSCVDRRRQAG